METPPRSELHANDGGEVKDVAFVFVIGVGCASAADLNEAGDAPALDVVDQIGPDVQLRPDVVDDVSASQIRPDVQKVYIPEKYTNLEKEQNRPIASFWDHVFPFDINNMTECGMGS